MDTACLGLGFIISVDIYTLIEPFYKLHVTFVALFYKETKNEIYFQYGSKSKEDDEAMDSSFKQLFRKLAGVVSRMFLFCQFLFVAPFVIMI